MPGVGACAGSGADGEVADVRWHVRVKCVLEGNSNRPHSCWHCWHWVSASDESGAILAGIVAHQEYCPHDVDIVDVQIVDWMGERL